MRLNQRSIGRIVVLGCLAYASSANAGFNPGPIQIGKPAVAATPDHNSKPAPDLPAEASCDIDRLSDRLDGFKGQKEALEQELKHLGALHIGFESTLNSEALAGVDAKIEKTRHR